MKKYSTLIVALFIAFATGLSAQQKLGHINADELLQQMPETKSAQQELENYGRQLEKDLADMEDELESKITSFRSNEKMMTTLARENKTKELQELQMRIQSYSQRAQQDLQEKQVELLTPVIERATNAIKEVAKENKFTYIFDSSQSKAVLIFVEDGEDIMPLVKAKLGLQ